MGKEVNRAIVDTLKHWRKMIKWTKTQPSENVVSSSKMMEEIGEAWGGRHCPLCNLYGLSPCGGCPLYSAQGFVMCAEDGTLWRAVDDSRNWGEWTANAEKLYEFIASLRGYNGNLSLDGNAFGYCVFDDLVFSRVLLRKGDFDESDSG